jgi:hypothetical protein
VCIVSEERYPRQAFLGGAAILLLLALLKLLLHLSKTGNYGYCRDELYDIAASGRLGLGYVEFPPFAALVTAAARQLFGDSLLALHVFPTLAPVR